MRLAWRPWSRPRGDRWPPWRSPIPFAGRPRPPRTCGPDFGRSAAFPSVAIGRLVVGEAQAFAVVGPALEVLSPTGPLDRRIHRFTGGVSCGSTRNRTDRPADDRPDGPSDNGTEGNACRRTARRSEPCADWMRSRLFRQRVAVGGIRIRRRRRLHLRPPKNPVLKLMTHDSGKTLRLHYLWSPQPRSPASGRRRAGDLVRRT